MIYHVWCPELGYEREDAKAIEAFSPHHAAIAWADWYDFSSNDYPIVHGMDVKVYVLPEDGVVPYEFNVSGEVERVYFASEVKND